MNGSNKKDLRSARNKAKKSAFAVKDVEFTEPHMRLFAQLVAAGPTMHGPQQRKVRKSH